MPESFILLIIVVVLAVGFDFINGFHDTANAIATSVSTRVIPPTVAIIMAAVLNFVGALSGTAVAKTVGSGIVSPESVTQLTIVATLISAIVWDLITWYYGIPTSSSHALMASIVGAGLATGGLEVLVWSGLEKVTLALIFSPIIGFGAGYLLMIILFRIFHSTAPASVSNIFRNLQVASAAYMAFSHGSNDAQKTMGIITMALVSYYSLTDFTVPIWVILLCATAMGLGTAAGGWRIIKTMGSKIVRLQPIHGFAAETAAGTVIEIATRFGLPLSTTHVISSTIMGVGSSRRLSAVRWGVARNIVMAWVITLPICTIMAWAITMAMRMMFLRG